jgi:hypothetical protein
MFMEWEEIPGPEYYPTDPAFREWAHEPGSNYRGDQNVPLNHPRFRHMEQVSRPKLVVHKSPI